MQRDHCAGGLQERVRTALPLRQVLAVFMIVVPSEPAHVLGVGPVPVDLAHVDPHGGSAPSDPQAAVSGPRCHTFTHPLFPA